jgi:ABC-2 type transport system ATP-binding protein
MVSCPVSDNPNDMQPAIEIQELRKTFRGKRRSDVYALRDVSLTVKRGEVFGFLGPNGAGKTTTIKILMGLIAASGGTAKIMGMDAGTRAARYRIGYLPENPSFYDFLSAREYLAFAADVFALEISKRAERIHDTLRLLDLWDARDRPIRQYSKGMVQRLGLAQVLVHDPVVLILDEPMSGLDPIGRVLVKKIILDNREKGRSIFFSTHITSDVEAVCDRVGIIMDGSLRSVERVNTIMTEGIVGYHIHHRSASSAQDRVLSIKKEDIQKTLDELRTAGNVVTLIDPVRKDLEAFFLDIIKGRKA